MARESRQEEPIGHPGLPPPQRMLELIETFARHPEAYRAASYNEAQVRQEFIDPLFEALGWDVRNLQGFAAAYKDVIHEDAIKVGGETKAPDYCFRIGGTRKFFVEAKKPAVKIRDDRGPAYQLRRYAWSAKLPLSILTNFEEFAVYDCRVKPDQADNASKARVLYLTYKDYASRWDEIANVFSKQAILQGSFDQYAESHKQKRGTAEVDDAFLAEIEKWRDLLAKSFALRNRELSARDLNFAVQMTIDRIIFLRMCEDRGIEAYGQLRDMARAKNPYAELLKLFRSADDRYNSGLFHFAKDKGRPEPDYLTPQLKLDDHALKTLIKNLYYPDSPYEFSVLPPEILGHVYEQFLGKVIRLTAGHQAKIEDKPEVKKAGGVYYTPSYIVEYIVEQTLGELLKDKTPKDAASLRVLDPACGSGSFLIGAYQKLLDWHRDWYINDGTKKHAAKEIFQGPGGQWLLTTSEKKRILTSSIYGVDIDPQAVEVTKLSLLLKVLEGESKETLESQRRVFGERALPDLENNIKCGNSLIGPDFYNDAPVGLTEEDRYRINVFDWDKGFPEIMKQGGFHAVIGNPPYGAYLYEQDKPYLKTHYPHQTYQLDSYLLFLEKALSDLIRREGFYGMIIPNPWLTNLLQTSVRRFVLDDALVCSIVHFNFPVFPRVVVDTEVLVLRKQNAENWEVQVALVESLPAFVSRPWNGGIRVVKHQQKKWRDLSGAVINIFIGASEEKLAAKCSSVGVPLDSLCKINVGIKPYQVGKGTPPQTRQIVDERPFDSDRRVNAAYRQYLRGTDIKRFKIAPVERRYLKFGPWLAEPRPAANFDAPIKLLMRQTGDSLVAALDTRKFLCLNNLHVIVPKTDFPSPLYLLGVINSKLLNWYYHTLNPEVGEALAEVKKTNVARLPIRPVTDSITADRVYHDRMVELVERIHALYELLDDAKSPHERTNLQNQIDANNRQIDRLVYDLYGLSEDEIAIVERG